MTTENEKKALAEYLECDINSLIKENWSQWGLNVYKASKEEFAHEYAIGKEEQVNIACYNNIKDSLWAFKIAMNVFIVKGVFDKLSENKESELNEIVIDNAPSASITNSNGIPLFSSNNQRI